jgi:excisionase family DNA binding protein
MTDRLVYRVSEVADLLKVSRTQVYRLMAAGTIPVIRVGRAVRVPAWWIEEKTGRAA